MELPTITDESIESMRPAMERLMGLSDRLNSEDALDAVPSSARRGVEYLISPDPEFQASCTGPNKDARCSAFCPAPGYPGGGGEVIFIPFGNPVDFWELDRRVGLALAEAAFGSTVDAAHGYTVLR